VWKVAEPTACAKIDRLALGRIVRDRFGQISMLFACAMPNLEHHSRAPCSKRSSLLDKLFFDQDVWYFATRFHPMTLSSVIDGFFIAQLKGGPSSG
jgi:hypothetical protein